MQPPLWSVAKSLGYTIWTMWLQPAILNFPNFPAKVKQKSPKAQFCPLGFSVFKRESKRVFLWQNFSNYGILPHLVPWPRTNLVRLPWQTINATDRNVNRIFKTFRRRFCFCGNCIFSLKFFRLFRIKPFPKPYWTGMRHFLSLFFVQTVKFTIPRSGHNTEFH